MTELLPPSTQTDLAEINKVLILSDNELLHNAKKKLIIDRLWEDRAIYSEDENTAKQIFFEIRKKYLRAIDLYIEELD